MYEKDSARDIETQTLSVDVSDNQIHKTGNLPGKFKVCIGARVMLTANVNTSEYLVNGSTGKKGACKCLEQEIIWVGIIYVKFDNINVNQIH